MKYLYIVKSKNPRIKTLEYLIHGEPVVPDENTIIPELVRYESNADYLLFHNLHYWKYVNNRHFILPSGISNIREYFDGSSSIINFNFLFTEGSIAQRRVYKDTSTNNVENARQIIMTVYKMNVFDEYLVIMNIFSTKMETLAMRCSTEDDVKDALALKYCDDMDLSEFTYQDVPLSEIKTSHILQHTQGKLNVTFCTLD